MPWDAAGIAGIHVRAWQAAYRGLLADELLDALSVTAREAMWSDILRRSTGRSFALVAQVGALYVDRGSGGGALEVRLRVRLGG